MSNIKKKMAYKMKQKYESKVCGRKQIDIQKLKKGNDEKCKI